ncbi:hypothetical protein [Sandarakinorhabdus sp. DWP1-3-1]|uniref:hypothetical protein n=1 Tax=Sandarakinorhabdus sp. DWP1-3-1 TaxID=2804627 RepID=UPI003CEF5311
MASDPKKSLSVPIVIRLPEAGEDTLKQLQAVLYGRTGSALGTARLEVGRDGDSLIAKGTINVPEAALGQTARLTVAPLLDSDNKAPPLSRAKLEKQLAAYTEPLRLDRQRPQIELAIARPYWQPWPRLCFCWVRGRLVKRVTLPNGSTIDLPICNARVTVCEVDRWFDWITRLPDRDILRLRDDLLDIVAGPRKPPIPEPDPEPFPGPFPGLAINPASRASIVGTAAKAISPRRLPATARSLSGVTIDDFRRDKLEVPEWNRLAQGPAPLARQWLVADALYWRPWLCELAWLEPWFLTFKQCFATVPTDENGRFSALYIHACNGDQPDIYVSAEQLIGGTWTTIYQPSVRCHTHWNYVCGSEITVVVTDPRAQPCVPEPPVEPPSGVERWVLPHAIGGTFIGGTAGVGIPAGWVRPDGLTNYGSFVDAPFGSVLGFRQQHALGIPDAGIYYYRWSWRRGSSGDFTAMTEPVSRNYVRDVPGPGLAFPTVQLGPTLGDRFRFRTQVFSPADWGVDTSTDPAGTQYYWPIDGAVGDIYSARWVTPGTGDAVAAPGLADSYQVKLEVFSQANVLVAPGPATFQFLLPTSIEADGTINTRVAAPSEIDGGGLVFTVVVDNSRCDASIDPPVLSAGMADDDCGFLRYADGASLLLEFAATHPNDRAVFSFSVVRGITYVAAASTSGEVAASAPPYALAAGAYSHDFPVATLLESCPSAAFAADLYVTAKATNGNSRLQEYDRSALRAFALAEGG